MKTFQRDGMLVPAKVWDGDGSVPMEPGVLDQIADVCRLPFIAGHAAIMADGHVGTGGPVGAVVPMRGAAVPSITGVDLGCGMIAMETSLTSHHLGDSGREIFEAISKAVPHGRTDGGGANDRGAWDEPTAEVHRHWSKLARPFDPNSDSVGSRYTALIEKHPWLDTGRVIRQLGTLGGGNHFIEVCLDERDRMWLMLHSGSRGIGNRIGSHFIAEAKKRCEAEGITLPNKDLAWLPEGTPEFADYVEAVAWAQDYALANRRAMMSAVTNALGDAMTLRKQIGWHGRQAVECHHNYVSRETHFGEDLLITRKGAVSARLGELGIIPGAMGRASFIVRGKGNADSFHTCSHGAGRVMSRGAAKKAITLEQHAADTAGTICRQDAEVLDESPRAYKDVESVIAAQADLIDVVHRLTAVVCVKG